MKPEKVTTFLKIKKFPGLIKRISNRTIRKFEPFIFDTLQFTTNSVSMEVERSKEFSPVKNTEGEDSPQPLFVICAIYMGEWLEMAGVSVARVNGNVNGKLEISPLFAVAEDEFAKKRQADLGFYDGLFVE